MYRRSEFLIEDPPCTILPGMIKRQGDSCESGSRNICSLLLSTHGTEHWKFLSYLFFLRFTFASVNEIRFTFAQVFFQSLVSPKQKYVCFLLPASAYVRSVHLSAKVFS